LSLESPGIPPKVVDQPRTKRQHGAERFRFPCFSRPGSTRPNRGGGRIAQPSAPPIAWCAQATKGTRAKGTDMTGNTTARTQAVELGEHLREVAAWNVRLHLAKEELEQQALCEAAGVTKATITEEKETVTASKREAVDLTSRLLRIAILLLG